MTYEELEYIVNTTLINLSFQYDFTIQEIEEISKIFIEKCQNTIDTIEERCYNTIVR